MKENAAVLIVPCCEKSRGGGHIRRSLFLLRAHEDAGRECYLWISEHQKEDVFLRFRKFFESSDFSRGFHARLLSNVNDLTNRSWDYIVLDNFRTQEKEFRFWTSLGTVIGIDEGGPCRRRFDFLIDLLPALKGHMANVNAPALLPLPVKRRPLTSGKNPVKKTEALRVLISFGAEDSSGLGLSTARALASHPSSHEITLVSPDPGHDFSEVEKNFPGIKLKGLIPNMRESLAEYDLFITHFGIGAFEAVYARVPVLLNSPTAYHEKLAKNAGFLTLAKAQRRKGDVEYLQTTSVSSRLGVLARKILDSGFIVELEKRRENIARRFGLEGDQEEDLGTFFGGLSPTSPRTCPACEENIVGDNTVIARFPEETYRRCKYCGILFLSRLKAPPITYDEDYFFDFYKKQYGKTYIEDFPNLKKMARKRIVHINSLLNNESELKPSLFDIGCAYGPFMAAAAEAGFRPSGLDPIEDAVHYVNEELGLFAWQGFFPSGTKAEDGPFDAVTLWYVIEHFENIAKILREIHRILREGGVLAFSSPSFSGVSGRRNLSLFLKNSPGDHFTVLSPRTCKSILKRCGFSLKKIVVTGHHPERFPFFGRFVKKNRKNLLYRLLFLISYIFRLGDTFEVYCIKN